MGRREVDFLLHLGPHSNPLLPLTSFTKRSVSHTRHLSPQLSGGGSNSWLLLHVYLMAATISGEHSEGSGRPRRDVLGHVWSSAPY